MLFAVVALFSVLVGRGNGAPEVMPSVDAGGEQTNPNVIRLAYMCAACAGAFVLAGRAAALDRGRGAEAASFWMATMAGLLLWQGLGECAWHFGLSLTGNGYHSVRYVMFLRLESAASWPVFLPLLALLAYCRRRGAFSYPVGVFVLSFMGNWFGHIVMIGTYPPVSAFMGERAWFQITRPVIGGAVSAWACFRAAKKDTGARDARVSSLILYTGLGIIAMGLRGG